MVEDFLSSEVLSRWEVELEKLKPHIHRNYLPGHKKGGSVAYQTVNALAPSITGCITARRCSGSFVAWSAPKSMNVRRITPPVRLYAYTEEGDHMGWHYDTSYYKDRRWTVLVGFKDDPARACFATCIRAIQSRRRKTRTSDQTRGACYFQWR